MNNIKTEARMTTLFPEGGCANVPAPCSPSGSGSRARQMRNG